MFDILACIIFAIGLVAVAAAAVHFSSELIEKLTAARNHRHAVEKQILALLEAIKSNTNHKP